MICYVAPLRNTTLYYHHLPGPRVMVYRNDYKHMTIHQSTFDNLYFKFDDFTAALKENCIEYFLYDHDVDFETCPQWFIQAIEDGMVFGEEDYDDYIMYNKHGDVLLTPGCIVLRNFKGELNCIQRIEFDKYYEMLGDV